MEIASAVTNLDLLRELDEARSEADKIIDHIQKRLGDFPSSPAGFKRLEFMLSVREVRRHLEGVLDQEQRHGDAGESQRRSGFTSRVWLECGKLCWGRVDKTVGFYEYQDKEMPRRVSTVGSQLGQRIRDIRKTLSFTQEELAKKVGIGGSYLSMIERGRRTPHLETLVSIAAALGVTLSELFIDAKGFAANGVRVEDLPLLEYLGTLRLERTDVDVLLRIAKAMFADKP